MADDRYLTIGDHTDFPVVGKLDALQRELDAGPASTVPTESPADGIVVAADFAGEDGERWLADLTDLVIAGTSVLTDNELMRQ
ncbi:hypothetical protein EV188_101404 [Actinomycetospora succinea]|uniref:Uncharacterized protein n=1 Tax=Actinomycetospora succinea TaxID=663603 RepID=A0A4R6VX84_9PSEU|nr:hypothetical protein [Actinomycetospora succinea]TDQ65155.1 hypothetical protein EV188_101404 [Actinomycetospora succinea]